MPIKSSASQKMRNYFIRNSVLVTENKFSQYLKIYERYKNMTSSGYYIFSLFKTYEMYELKSPSSRTRRILISNKISNLTKYSCLLKNGKTEGMKKWKNYLDKKSFGESKEGKIISRGYTEEEYKAFAKTRAITLENMIRLYGINNGTTKFDAYCAKQSKVGCKLEYFVEKYGDVEGTKEYQRVNSTKGITLKNYINRLGEELGKIKFIEYNDKMAKRQGKSTSKSSQTFFENLGIDHSKIYYSKKNKEFNIFCNNDQQKMYFYDFVDTKNRKVIEYNGDLFHANPKIFSADELVPLINMRAKDVWEKDKIKNSAIENLGYKVLVVWESDIKEDRKGALDAARKFLLDK